MGFRFRRSVRIAPGIRLNLSKSGLSYSFGGRGATVNVSAKGTKATYGVPGTGLSYTTKLPSAKKPRKQPVITGGPTLVSASAPTAGRRFSLKRAIGVAAALFLAVGIASQFDKPPSSPAAKPPQPVAALSQPVVWTTAPPPPVVSPVAAPTANPFTPAAPTETPTKQPAAPPPAPTAEARQPAGETLYVSGHKVPLRATAGSKGKILDRLGPGQEVTALEKRPGWVRVRHGLTQREGWILAKRLRDAPPVEEAEEPAAPKISPALTVAAIAKLLIADSIASYPSSCACPYQSDRGGRSCGRRSAYSRPGGYAPLCYASDITPAMVAGYRASH